MIQVESVHHLEEMEAALCLSAQRHGAHIITVQPLTPLLKEDARRAAHDAISFTICHSALYGALLAAELRFSVFLPCRIAAIRRGTGVTLETLSPKHFCHHLNRPDLDRLVAPLETLLHELLEEMASAIPQNARQKAHKDAELGAREGQVSMRGSIPQRIDCRGTKVEDLAGTGEVDAPGG